MKLNEKIQASGVAAAVAIACGAGVAGVASAASFGTAAGSTLTLSSQYVELAAATHLTEIKATVTLGVAHASGDRVRINVTGGTFGTGTLANVGTVGGTGCGNIEPLSYADGTAANYRLNSSGASAGAVCEFTLNVRTRSITTTGLTFSNFIAGTTEALETAISRTVAVGTSSQFGAAVGTRFAGVVDVEKDRYHFASDDPSASAPGLISGGYESQLVFSVTNATAGFNTFARVSAVTVSVVGDFSWLDDDGSNSCAANDVTNGPAIAAQGNAVGNNGTWSFACGASGTGTLSFFVTGGNTGVSVTTGLWTIAVGKNVTNTTALSTNSLGMVEKRIPAPASYSTSVTFTYFNGDTGASTVGTVSPVSGASAGSFSLNGSSINVPFMPYATGISRVLYLTNRSAQTGAVSLSVVADGTAAACSGTGSVTAKANGVTLLTTLLDDTVTACYGESFAGKVGVTITSNTPGASTEIFSAYNRSGSLTTVVNSSNGK